MPTIEAEISQEAKAGLDFLLDKTRFDTYGEIIEEALGLNDDETRDVFERGGEGTSVFSTRGDGSSLFKY